MTAKIPWILIGALVMLTVRGIGYRLVATDTPTLDRDA